MKNEDYYVTPRTWSSPSASASVSLLWGVCKEGSGPGQASLPRAVCGLLHTGAPWAGL